MKLFATLLLYYFRFFARWQLRKIHPEIIGVTGSSGKTSVMEAVTCVLQDDFSVKMSDKANSQSGLPLNILGLSVKSFSLPEWLKLAVLAPIKLLTNWQKYQIYIAEMGIDSAEWPANMEYLLTFLRPNIGIFTNVTSVHAQAFDHLATSSDPDIHHQQVLQAIASEKGKLIQRLPKNGYAILFEDDALVNQQATLTQATVRTFGTKPSASVQLVETQWTAQGTEFVLKDTMTEGQSNTKPVKIALSGYLLPKHFGLSFAAAGGVGLIKGISLATSCERLQTHFRLPPGRASLLPALHGATILDSSYNSSPLALWDFLEMLQTIQQSSTHTNQHQPDFHRYIGLLGDMREIGQATQQEHEAIAHRAATVFDQVFLIGPAMQQFAAPIFHTHHIPCSVFDTAWTAIDPIKQVLQPNDLLLVKGSQNTILLETTIAALLQNPKDQEKLCRREEFWSKQRAKLKSYS